MLEAKPAKSASKAKGKAKAKAKKPARKSAGRKFIVLDSSDVEGGANSDEESVSEDDYKDSDLSDFIVESDEDEEEKDARRAIKNRLGKRRAITTIVDSDEEEDDEIAPEEKELLFGAKKKKLTKAEIKLMPRFLPSTKMKAMMEVLKKLAEEKPDEKVRRLLSSGSVEFTLSLQTLIVSQWTGCLNIVSDYLTEAGIVHVKYVRTSRFFLLLNDSAGTRVT